MNPARRFPGAALLVALALLGSGSLHAQEGFCEDAALGEEVHGGERLGSSPAPPGDPLVLAATACANVGNARDNTPYPLEILADFVPIVPNDSVGFWVVYSPRKSVELDGSVGNTAAIFVIPLEGDEILVFGAGYGDPFSGPSSALYDAATDAAKVDVVVRNCMGREPSTARIRFVAPHGHGDHANGPFLREMRALGYEVLEIVFHQGDYGILTTFPGWTPVDRAVFRTLPAARICNETLQAYDSPLGRVWVLSRPGHTQGCLDAVIDVGNDPNNRFVVRGSLAGGTCPDEPTGTRTVVNPHGNTILYPVQSLPTAPPALTSATPDRASPGDSVTLLGRGFLGEGAGSAEVLFGGVPATDVVVETDGRLTCTVPAGSSSGPVELSLRNANGSASLAGGFTYDGVLALAEVTPDLGTSLGGTEVTLSGQGFLPSLSTATLVSFGGVPATDVRILSDTELSCRTPPGPPGTAVGVRVDNALGSVTLRGAFTYRPLPTLDAVLPQRGPALGEVVLLIGTGFPAQTPAVRFGGVESRYVGVESPTQIRCLAPPGTPGTVVDVEVDSLHGRAVARQAFTYNPLPSLSRVEPSAGSAEGGTALVLRGKGFLAHAAGTITVLIGGSEAADVVVFDDTTLGCRTPPGVSRTVADVELRNRNGTALLPGAFAYDPTLELSSLAPVAGPATGDTPVVLSGAGFLDGPLRVTFGGVDAPWFQVESDARLVCRTPAARSVGAVDVVVANDRFAARLPYAFDYEAPPVILESVRPRRGTSLGGTLVTLTGSGFQDLDAGPARVFLDDLSAADVQVLDDRTLTFRTPAGPPGATTSLRVENAHGTSTELLPFTFNPLPELRTVLPSPGSAGQLVGLTGAGFANYAPGENAVSFGGTPARVERILNDTQILVEVPPGPPGTELLVTVENRNGGTPRGASFRYVDAPSITAVEPSVASSLGGSEVTLLGSGFADRTGAPPRVVFGATEASSVLLLDDGRLTCLLPAGAPGTAPELGVTNANGTGSAGGLFRYAAAPVVERVEPGSAPATGGTLVTVHGSGFLDDGAGPANVRFGGLAATGVEVLDDARLTCLVPPGTADSVVAVSVSNANGRHDRPDAFLYHGPLALDACEPAAGTSLGGTRVLLRGQGFAAEGSWSVDFAGSPAGALEILDDSTLACTAPPGTPGTAVTVRVVVDGGTGTPREVSLAAGYAYHPTPTLLGLTPDSGSSLGGTLVTLRGTGFQALEAGLATVRLGGVLASEVRVLDDRTATCRSPGGDPGAVVGVSLLNGNGLARLASAFRHHALPELLAVEPGLVPREGGTPLTLTGSGFARDAAGPVTVTIGGAPATSVVVLDDLRLTCDSPEGVEGTTVDVRLSNANGESLLAGGLSYAGAPVLSSIEPATGTPLGGTPITVRGTGFLDDRGTLLLTLDGVEVADAVVVDDTTVVGTTPAGASGRTVDVLLSNRNGSALGQGAFRYRRAPVLDSLEPASTSSLGGASLLLVGRAFSEAPRDLIVLVDGVPATGLELIDDSTLRVPAPRGTPGAVVDVSVSGSNGSSTLAGALRYHERPRVDEVLPASGTSLGGTRVRLRGAGFLLDSPGMPSIRFGATPATAVSILDDANVVCTAPAGPPGTAVDVVLRNSNGTTTASGAYGYHPSPTLTAVEPSTGPDHGGVPVLLLGSGFLNGEAGPPAVAFGGLAATDVQVQDDSSLQCLLPPAAPGPVGVSLSNANGATSLVDGFAYVRALLLTELSPTSGKSAGKTLVTLRGSGFGTPVTPRVLFGGKEAGSVLVLDDDTLTCETPGAQPGDVVDVLVTSQLGTALLPLAYEYANGSAAVVGSEPDGGDPEAWTPVVLSGSGFTALDESELSVSFGGRLADEPLVVDDATITCLAPPGPAGTETDLVVADAEDATRLADGWRWASGVPGDLDDDGWSDLLTRLADGRPAVRFGRGPLDFGPALLLEALREGPGAPLPIVADTNGDGVPDLLEVRAPERAEAPAELVVHLGPLERVADSAFPSRSSARELGPGTPGEPLVLDLDGDGRSEVLVPLRDPGTGAGEVRCVAGAASTSDDAAVALLRIPPSPAREARLPLRAGDLDGDGRTDLLLGDPDSRSGAVHVYLAPGLGEPPAEPSWSLLGERPGDRLGTSLSLASATLGGPATLLVGAPGHDGAGPSSGAVLVFDGAELVARPLAQEPRRVVTGAGPGAELGLDLLAPRPGSDAWLALGARTVLELTRPAAEDGRSRRLLEHGGAASLESLGSSLLLRAAGGGAVELLGAARANDGDLVRIDLRQTSPSAAFRR